MPLYEYRCSICGAQEEKLQGFSAATEHDCSICQAPSGMARQISRTAFALAGSGWYASGYGAEGGTPKPADSAPAEKPASDPPKACGGGCACH